MQKLIPFLKYFIPFSGILYLTQYFISSEIEKNQGIHFFYSVSAIYVFHVLSTLLIYLFLQFVNKNFADKTGFAFLACCILKMFAVVVFLIPLIQSDIANPLNDIASFFIPYFLFLFFETIFAIRLINSK